MLEEGPHGNAGAHLLRQPPIRLDKQDATKRYTQQVRRQSWRNPKGGILSTEVVFSICTFFLNFVFFLEVGLGEGGSLPHLCGWPRTWPQGGVGVFPPSSMRFFFHFWEEVVFMREQVDVLERRVYRRAATFLVCGAGGSREGQAAWRPEGSPSSPSSGRGRHAEAKLVFSAGRGWAHLFCMKLKLTI